MQAEYELHYHDVESRHWWFRSRRAFILQLLRKVPRTAKVLDIGCSSGIMMLDLARCGFDKANLFGIDISSQAIANAQSNGLKQTYVMDAQSVKMDQKFDIIIASDCLEHLADDHQALANWRELLAPGGTLYVFVPAFQSLWSHHDEVNMHFRRYTRKELVAKARGAGLSISTSGFWNVLLFIPVWLYRRVSRLRENPKGDIGQPAKWVNNALTSLLKIEHPLLRIFRFPFGVSTYIIANR